MEKGRNLTLKKVGRNEKLKFHVGSNEYGLSEKFDLLPSSPTPPPVSPRAKTHSRPPHNKHNIL